MIDVVISFDTTGSMYPCLTQVRRTIRTAIQRLFKDIPDLQIGIIAHGDYCDGARCITLGNLTSNENKLVEFVAKVEATSGGDAPECYEFVINQALEKMSWRDGAKKLLVMFGDAESHTKGERTANYTVKHDILEEARVAKQNEIKIYGVHCMPGYCRGARDWMKQVTKITDGLYLTLDQLNGGIDLISAICYQQHSRSSLDQFVTEVELGGRSTRGIQISFSRLKGEEVNDDFTSSDFYSKPRMTYSGALTAGYATLPKGLEPVPAGRFQVIKVDDEQDISGFVRDQGLTFKQGRGFYELSPNLRIKPVVQQYKEIVLMHRVSGDIFHGDKARKLLGLQPQSSGKSGLKETLDPKSTYLKDYRVFIQSTSNNRVLAANSFFLYDVS